MKNKKWIFGVFVFYLFNLYGNNNTIKAVYGKFVEEKNITLKRETPEGVVEIIQEGENAGAQIKWGTSSYKAHCYYFHLDENKRKEVEGKEIKLYIEYFDSSPGKIFIRYTSTSSSGGFTPAPGNPVILTGDKTWKKYEAEISDAELKGKGNYRSDIQIAIYEKIEGFSIRTISIEEVIKAKTDISLPEPVFHFEFREPVKTREITDRTGNFKCISKYGTLVIEKDALNKGPYALRIAPDAQIYIPSEKLPDISKELTLSAWVLKKSTPQNCPILFKGIHPDPVEFIFSLVCWYPGFGYKNIEPQHFWKGLYPLGGGSGTHYEKQESIIPGAKFVESSGYWHHIASVFNKGEVKLYVDGKLVARAKSEKEEFLKTNSYPIIIGGEPQKGTDDYYQTADMLINDIRLYSKALTDEMIRKIYEEEEKKYPKGSLIPPGETHLNALPSNYEYLKAKYPEFDPTLEKPLPITKEYEQKISSLVYGLKEIKASIKKEGDVSHLVINDRKISPLIAIPSLRDMSTLKVKTQEFKTSIKDFAAAGVDLIGVLIYPEFFWMDENVYDWKQVDALIQSVIESNPMAQIMLYVVLTPPKWFCEKYPEELERSYIPGQKEYYIERRAGPLGSQKWLDESIKMVRSFVIHIEESSYSNHIFAYLPGGGQSCEWYWPGSVYGRDTGYSEATRKSFIEWLRTKYKGDITLLRKAWNNPDIDFDCIQVPSPERRKYCEKGFIFSDTKKFKDVFDFREFMSDRTIYAITETARTIKEASNNKKLVVVYNGYPMQGMVSHKLYNSGHQNSHKVFLSPYVDIVVTPMDYAQRMGGETGLIVNPFNGTAALYSKLIFQEDDIRTHLNFILSDKKTRSLKETIEVIKRGAGYALTRNNGLWWLLFDNSWFHQQEIMETVRDVKKVMDEALVKNRKNMSEVALIFDEKSPLYLSYISSNPNYTNFLMSHTWGVYQEIVRAGVPFSVYFLDDLKNPAMPDYKLYIFLNVFYADSSMREVIKNKVRKNNSISVWCYAPGYITEKGYGTEGMSELTGIKLNEIKEERAISLTVNKKVKEDVTSIIKYSLSFPSFKIGPVFYTDDPDVRILGTYEEKPVFVLKEFKGWRSIYSLLPLTKELIRGICEYAGIHIYTKEYDIFTANDRYLMIHATTPGSKTISLPDKYTVKECFSGRIIGKNIQRFTEEFDAYETRVYQLDK